MSYPDFLCIGAQKAGTTWLYENLRQHPNVWLPPLKEIHYFDRSARPYVFDMVSSNYRTRYLFKRWLKPAGDDVQQSLTHLLWYLHFFLLPRDNRWYSRLFTPPYGHITGDITPAYARLTLAQVKDVHRLLPHTKIIYILRDPIERMWSQAAMYFSRFGYNGLDQAPEKDILSFLQWPLAQANSDYLSNWQRWQTVYATDQLFIAFFDQLQHDPVGFLTQISKFLGITPFIPDSIQNKVHHRSYAPLPAHLGRRLAADNYEVVEALHAYFHNEYTASWLQSLHSWLVTHED